MIPSTVGFLDQDFEIETQPSLTYKMDLDGDSVRGLVDEQDAMKQMIFRTLQTERYQYIIYPWYYGIETLDLYGEPVTWVCPGDWLYNRLGDLAARVTANLGGGQSSDGTLYRVQTGAFSVKENADRMLEKVKTAGFDTYMVQVDGLYKIQVGAYSVKTNADAMASKLKAAGFDTFITTHGGQAVSTTSTPTREVTIGSAVRLKKGAKTYSGGSLASFVYERNHQVTQLSGDRAVISFKGTVVAAVHKDDLILV